MQCAMQEWVERVAILHLCGEEARKKEGWGRERRRSEARLREVKKCGGEGRSRLGKVTIVQNLNSS